MESDRKELFGRPGDPFDGPMVLLDYVVQVIVLTHQDVNTGVSLDAFNGRSRLFSNSDQRVVYVFGKWWPERVAP